MLLSLLLGLRLQKLDLLLKLVLLLEDSRVVRCLLFQCDLAGE